MPIFPELWMAVSYYLRPKEPKKLLLVDGGRHDPNFVTLCNSAFFIKTRYFVARAVRNETGCYRFKTNISLLRSSFFFIRAWMRTDLKRHMKSWRVRSWQAQKLLRSHHCAQRSSAQHNAALQNRSNPTANKRQMSEYNLSQYLGSVSTLDQMLFTSIPPQTIPN